LLLNAHNNIEKTSLSKIINRLNHSKWKYKYLNKRQSKNSITNKTNLIISLLFKSRLQIALFLSKCKSTTQLKYQILNRKHRKNKKNKNIYHKFHCLTVIKNFIRLHSDCQALSFMNRNAKSSFKKRWRRVIKGQKKMTLYLVFYLVYA